MSKFRLRVLWDIPRENVLTNGLLLIAIILFVFFFCIVILNSCYRHHWNVTQKRSIWNLDSIFPLRLFLQKETKSELYFWKIYDISRTLMWLTTVIETLPPPWIYFYFTWFLKERQYVMLIMCERKQLKKQINYLMK